MPTAKTHVGRTRWSALAVAVAIALGSLVGVEKTGGPIEAAGVLEVRLISPSACLALMRAACVSGPTTVWPSSVDFIVGDNDGKIEPSDFDPLELDADQLHQEDDSALAGLWVVAFVDDDAPVLFEPEAGKVASGLYFPLEREYLCDRALEDEDCDQDGVAGDGVVTAVLYGAGAQLGPSALRVTTKGIQLRKPYTVVGEPDSVTFSTLESAISTGIKDLNGDGDLGDTGECPLDLSTEAFTIALGRPEKTIIIAHVRDAAGTPVAGAWVTWSTDDKNKAVLAGPQIPTVDTGLLGIGSPNILCGTASTGTVTVTAAITRSIDGAGLVDPKAEQDEGTIKFTVGGSPATVTLSVTPESMACDGANSAEVAATVKDADGNLVVNGTEVRFDVRVLGTANPIKATTTDGVAKTKVTPLAVQNTGVPVIVTAGNVQASALVKCGAGAPGAAPAPPPAAPPPPAPSGAPAGVTRPPAAQPGLPRSGDSGLAASSELPWLALAGLAAAAVTLTSGAIVVRRRAR